MKVVIITKEEIKIVGHRNYGITSGKKDKNGVRPTIYFCEEYIFDLHFTREKEFINI